MSTTLEAPAGVKLPIYLDNHATTPDGSSRVGCNDAVLHQQIRQTPLAATTALAGEAEQAVETAREQIAKLIGASAKEIIFTSGATESNNLAIKGVAEMYKEKGDHIITAATEHKGRARYLQAP